MKKQIATLFSSLLLLQGSLTFAGLEVNASYDYFRASPEGSWNGNNGAFISGNFGTSLYNCVGLQLGGSYGLYDWDGHENLVFRNESACVQQVMLTGGFFSSLDRINVGVVYDRQFVRHYGLYDAKINIDQCRFQVGYEHDCNEIGLWGTSYLTTSHSRNLSLPLSFRAVSQLNIFWSHFFENSAVTTIWAGVPYRNSLLFRHKTAGIFIAGLSFRAPLSECLFIDAHGSYMHARKTVTSPESPRSRNYAANICIGITYLFGDQYSLNGVSYMPLANNANFIIDTNTNN